MSIRDQELTFWRVGFPDDLVAWLLELAEASHTPVDQLVPALIAGVKQEAEETGATIHAGISRETLN